LKVRQTTLRKHKTRTPRVPECPQNGGFIFETIQNKGTYSVDVFLAIFLIKNDRSQNGRLRDGAVNQLNYRSFLA